MKKIEIFTDGACSGNPGPGGYGVILRYKGNSKELWGGDPSIFTRNLYFVIININHNKLLKVNKINFLPQSCCYLG